MCIYSVWLCHAELLQMLQVHPEVVNSKVVLNEVNYTQRTLFSPPNPNDFPEPIVQCRSELERLGLTGGINARSERVGYNKDVYDDAEDYDKAEDLDDPRDQWDPEDFDDPRDQWEPEDLDNPRNQWVPEDFDDPRDQWESEMDPDDQCRAQ